MADKKIVIYTTPTWPHCHRAKEYLSNKGLAYEEHDVAADRNAAKEMIAKILEVREEGDTARVGAFLAEQFGSRI